MTITHLCVVASQHFTINLIITMWSLKPRIRVGACRGRSDLQRIFFFKNAPARIRIKVTEFKFRTGWSRDKSKLCVSSCHPQSLKAFFPGPGFQSDSPRDCPILNLVAFLSYFSTANQEELDVETLLCIPPHGRKEEEFNSSFPFLHPLPPQSLTQIVVFQSPVTFHLL